MTNLCRYRICQLLRGPIVWIGLFMLCATGILACAQRSGLGMYRLDEVGQPIWIPVDNQTGGSAVLGVYHLDGNGAPKTRRYPSRLGTAPSNATLVAAAWEDGTVFVGNLVDESQGQFQAAPVTAVRERAHALLESLSTCSRVRKYLILDGGEAVIFARDGDRIVSMRSSHEVFEADPRLVVTDRGVRSLTNTTRDEVLAGASKEYRAFRACWASSRDIIQQLIEHH